jgi:hypothetical protein
MVAKVIGLDTAKHVFQVHGADESGPTVVRKRLRRASNSRLRDECLNANWFRNLIDARAKISAWRDEYSGERPMSLLTQ